MPLPAPVLDNRRVQEFVDGTKRLARRRIPAWTDHNVHGVGGVGGVHHLDITQIEATLTGREPRTDVLDVDTRPDPTVPAVLRIPIGYRIKATDNLRNPVSPALPRLPFRSIPED